MSTEEQKDSEEREGLDPEARLGSTDDADEEGDDELRASASDDASTSDDDDTSDSDESESDDADTSAAADEPASTKSSTQIAARAAAAGAAGSAGARLAAAKAAKAAKKAARKSRDAAGTGVPGGGSDPTKESVEALKESSIGQAAAKASDWAQTNRNLAAGIFGVIVLGALGWVGFAWWNSSQAESAGALLEDAIEIATAEIRTSDATEDEPATASDDADEAPTFATREERSQAALEAYRRVTSEHGDSEAATWARLGEARALFDLGQMDEARATYEQALRDAGGDPIVAWRALEGIGFTYEVAEQWAEAIEKYEELRSIEDGAYQAPADYHIARMRIAMGETVPATTMLRELVTSLRASGEGEEPEFPFVLAQAEVRLRQLDPSAVSGSSPMMVGPEGAGGELPPGLEGIDPQILEQLRRQLQQQGAGAGEGE